MIVIDAGHGGSDPGGSGNGIVEKDYNLKISNYQLDRFKQLGTEAKATRTTDVALTPEERVRKVLNAFGNRHDVVVLVNHLNIGGGDGAEVVYALRDSDTLSKLILQDLAAAGQNTRKWYQRRLPSDPSKDYYFILRNTGVTQPVLIEYGFMDNTADATLIKNHWRSLAEAVVKAVSTYLKIPYSPPSGTTTLGGTYTVKSGDSLYSIAKKFGISADELKRANNLTSNLLSIGQVLKIPGTETTYTVKSGDSLYSIASKYNTTPTAIKEFNNLTSNLLSIGQVLKIPSSRTTSPSSDTTINNGTYTVQKGDSLWTIANKYNTTPVVIKNLNNLTSDILNIGQVLQVPDASTEGPAPNTYIVKAGDNLYDLASTFNVAIDELKSLNHLTSDALSIGQVLVLPADRVDQNQVIKMNKYLEDPSFMTTPYTVRYGDSLWIISNLYNVPVSAIREVNNLTSDLITVGQVLIIPIRKPIHNVHTVEQGDNLWTIARKYNTTVDELMRLNALSSNMIFVGQQIKLPL